MSRTNFLFARFLSGLLSAALLAPEPAWALRQIEPAERRAGLEELSKALRPEEAGLDKQTLAFLRRFTIPGRYRRPLVVPRITDVPPNPKRQLYLIQEKPTVSEVRNLLRNRRQEFGIYGFLFRGRPYLLVGVGDYSTVLTDDTILRIKSWKGIEPILDLHNQPAGLLPSKEDFEYLSNFSIRKQPLISLIYHPNTRRTIEWGIQRNLRPGRPSRKIEIKIFKREKDAPEVERVPGNVTRHLGYLRDHYLEDLIRNKRVLRVEMVDPEGRWAIWDRQVNLRSALLRSGFVQAAGLEEVEEVKRAPQLPLEELIAEPSKEQIEEFLLDELERKRNPWIRAQDGRVEDERIRQLISRNRKKLGPQAIKWFLQCIAQCPGEVVVVPYDFLNRAIGFEPEGRMLLIAQETLEQADLGMLSFALQKNDYTELLAWAGQHLVPAEKPKVAEPAETTAPPTKAVPKEAPLLGTSLDESLAEVPAVIPLEPVQAEPSIPEPATPALPGPAFPREELPPVREVPRIKAVAPREISIDELPFGEALDEILDRTRWAGRGNREWSRLLARLLDFVQRTEKVGPFSKRTDPDREAMRAAYSSFRKFWNIDSIEGLIHQARGSSVGQDRSGAKFRDVFDRPERKAIHLAVLIHRAREGMSEEQRLGPLSDPLPLDGRLRALEYLPRFRQQLMRDGKKGSFLESPYYRAGFLRGVRGGLDSQDPFGILSVLAARQFGQEPTIRPFPEIARALMSLGVRQVDYIPPAEGNPPALLIHFDQPFKDRYMETVSPALAVAVLSERWPDLPDEPKTPWDQMSEEEWLETTVRSMETERGFVHFDPAHVEGLAFKEKDPPSQKMERCERLIDLALEEKLVPRWFYLLLSKEEGARRYARVMGRSPEYQAATLRHIELEFGPWMKRPGLPPATPEIRKKLHLQFAEWKSQMEALKALEIQDLSHSPEARRRATALIEGLSSEEKPFAMEDWYGYRPLLRLVLAQDPDGQWVLDGPDASYLIRRLKNDRHLLWESQPAIARTLDSLSEDQGEARAVFLSELNQAALRTLVRKPLSLPTDSGRRALLRLAEELLGTDLRRSPTALSFHQGEREALQEQARLSLARFWESFPQNLEGMETSLAELQGLADRLEALGPSVPSEDQVRALPTSPKEVPAFLETLLASVRHFSAQSSERDQMGLDRFPPLLEAARLAQAGSLREALEKGAKLPPQWEGDERALLERFRDGLAQAIERKKREQRRIQKERRKTAQEAARPQVPPDQAEALRILEEADYKGILQRERLMREFLEAVAQGKSFPEPKKGRLESHLRRSGDDPERVAEPFKSVWKLLEGGSQEPQLSAGLEEAHTLQRVDSFYLMDSRTTSRLEVTLGDQFLVRVNNLGGTKFSPPQFYLIRVSRDGTEPRIELLDLSGSGQSRALNPNVEQHSEPIRMEPVSFSGSISLGKAHLALANLTVDWRPAPDRPWTGTLHLARQEPHSAFDLYKLHPGSFIPEPFFFPRPPTPLRGWGESRFEAGLEERRLILPFGDKRILRVGKDRIRIRAVNKSRLQFGGKVLRGPRLFFHLKRKRTLALPVSQLRKLQTSGRVPVYSFLSGQLEHAKRKISKKKGRARLAVSFRLRKGQEFLLLPTQSAQELLAAQERPTVGSIREQAVALTVEDFNHDGVQFLVEVGEKFLDSAGVGVAGPEMKLERAGLEEMSRRELLKTIAGLWASEAVGLRTLGNALGGLSRAIPVAAAPSLLVQEISQANAFRLISGLIVGAPHSGFPAELIRSRTDDLSTEFSKLLPASGEEIRLAAKVARYEADAQLEKQTSERIAASVYDQSQMVIGHLTGGPQEREQFLGRLRTFLQGGGELQLTGPENLRENRRVWMNPGFRTPLKDLSDEELSQGLLEATRTQLQEVQAAVQYAAETTEQLLGDARRILASAETPKLTTSQGDAPELAGPPTPAITLQDTGTLEDRRGAVVLRLKESFPWVAWKENIPVVSGASLRVPVEVNIHAHLADSVRGNFADLEGITWRTVPQDPGETTAFLRQFSPQEGVYQFAILDPLRVDAWQVRGLLPSQHLSVFLVPGEQASSFTPEVAATLLSLGLPANGVFLLKLKRGESGELLLDVFA